ncbi:phage tail assembly chaperone family protein, TAC [Microbulbifer sp. OS29]|uniref:Phage tail assembly chaperone family protein, TAC n=1 Tax=Microbulbifer okhotskensis TaxID=2926617 RepID=A0A9X2ERD1_9GAMM|nr:phage tail assembly chaperone family protein, TAC [Microbulbifer okhotskensis]MCO1337039.1 phage tail assembly chaperone family protein, TAC [Microbulbifer okhotskensis]
MELSIESLQEQGAFSGAPVERSITWKQGKDEFTATVHIRRLSYYSAVNDVAALRGEGDVIAGRIAACVLDAEGKPVFTPADITGEADPGRGPLNADLTQALLLEIGAVNNLGKPPSSAS